MPRFPSAARWPAAPHGRPPARLRLSPSDELFRLLVESVQDYAIFALDPEGQVVTWNRGAERITGYRPQDILGKHVSVFVPADQPERRRPERDLTAAARHGRMEYEGWQARSDGSRFWGHVLITALRDPERRLVGFAQITRDLSEQREDEAEHARLNEEARVAGRAKSDFLAVMSHELRTPLNAVLGYSDLLLLGVPTRLAARSRRYVERIRGAARHLLQMLDEMMSYAMVQAGRERLRIDCVETADLVREVATLAGPLASEKGLSFCVEHPGRGQPIVTDSEKVKDILLNILTNAIKFSEEGQVRLETDVGPEWVTFRVADTGPGIAPEHLERVFEPFWQAERALTRRPTGTGLGLTVARRFARLLGGDVTLSSHEGEGTLVTVRLPLDPRQPGG